MSFVWRNSIPDKSRLYNPEEILPISEIYSCGSKKDGLTATPHLHREGCQESFVKELTILHKNHQADGQSNNFSARMEHANHVMTRKSGKLIQVQGTGINLDKGSNPRGTLKIHFEKPWKRGMEQAHINPRPTGGIRRLQLVECSIHGIHGIHGYHPLKNIAPASGSARRSPSWSTEVKWSQDRTGDSVNQLPTQLVTPSSK